MWLLIQRYVSALDDEGDKLLRRSAKLRRKHKLQRKHTAPPSLSSTSLSDPLMKSPHDENKDGGDVDSTEVSCVIKQGMYVGMGSRVGRVEVVHASDRTFSDPQGKSTAETMGKNSIEERNAIRQKKEYWLLTNGTLDIVWLSTGTTQENVEPVELSLVVNRLTDEAKLAKVGWQVEWPEPVPDQRVPRRSLYGLYEHQPDESFDELEVHKRLREERLEAKVHSLEEKMSSEIAAVKDMVVQLVEALKCE